MINEDAFLSLRKFLDNNLSLSTEKAWERYTEEHRKSPFDELSLRVTAFLNEIDGNRFAEAFVANPNKFHEYILERTGWVEDQIQFYIDSNEHYGIKSDFITVANRLLGTEKQRIITFKISFMKQIEGKSHPDTALSRLRWLGSAEQFGYIFGELVSKGYLELPTRQGEGSISKLAELCLMYFDIQTSKGKTKGKQTTKENLERALNPESNRLSIKGKATLELPPIGELK